MADPQQKTKIQPVDQEVLVAELETRVDRLRSLYDQYFMGIEKLQPSVVLKDVERRFQFLRKQQIRNTALRFRFQVVVQKFSTYQAHWQRICRQIEEGTYKRDVRRAKERFGGARKGRGKEIEVEVDMADFDATELDMADLTEDLEPAATTERGHPALDSLAPPATTDNAAFDFSHLDESALAAPPAPPAARSSASLMSLDDPDDGMMMEPRAPVEERSSAARPAEPPKRVLRKIGAPQTPQAFAPVGVPAPGSAPKLGAPPAQMQNQTPQAFRPGLPAGAIPQTQTPQAFRPGFPAAPSAPGSLQTPQVFRPIGAPGAAPPGAPGAPPPGGPKGLVRPGGAPFIPQAAPAPNPAPPQPPPAMAATAQPQPRTQRKSSRPPGRKRSAPPDAPAPPAEAKKAPPAAAAPAPPEPRAAAAAPAPAPARKQSRPPAAQRPAPAPAPARPAPRTKAEGELSDERVRQLYTQYIEAKRSRQESTASLTYDSLAKSLRESTAKLRQKHDGKNVDFEVTVKDGKTILRPVVK